MPAFDSCMPLMIRLHQRGKVDVKIIINHRLIKIDPRYFRATEVETLLGDASNAGSAAAYMSCRISFPLSTPKAASSA